MMREENDERDRHKEQHMICERINYYSMNERIKLATCIAMKKKKHLIN
jgi:hypothetical protein